LRGLYEIDEQLGLVQHKIKAGPSKDKNNNYILKTSNTAE
jgi:hypothetical protein